MVLLPRPCSVDTPGATTMVPALSGSAGNTLGQVHRGTRHFRSVGARVYRRDAVGIAGRVAIVLLVLAMRPGDASVAGWTDARVVGPLICRADFPLDRLDSILNDLAGLQTDLMRVLGVPVAKEPIQLYLFHDKATYSRYLSRYLPNVPYRRALYVKSQGQGSVFAYWSRDFEIDLRHECTHALLHASLSVVPLWLDEGLATYFEVPDRQRATGNPHLTSIRWNLKWGPPPQLDMLERKASVAEMGRAEYRDCWAWVHFMIHGPHEAHEELVGMLADIRSGTPSGMLSARLQQRLPDLQQRFVEHFRANSWVAGP